MVPSNHDFISSNCSMPQEYVQGLRNVELTVRLGTRVGLAGNGLYASLSFFLKFQGFLSVVFN